MLGRTKSLNSLGTLKKHYVALLSMGPDEHQGTVQALVIHAVHGFLWPTHECKLLKTPLLLLGGGGIQDCNDVMKIIIFVSMWGMRAKLAMQSELFRQAA